VNKKYFVLMLPGAATTVVVVALLRLAPADSAVLLDAAHGFPYLVLGAAAVLAWRLRSTRLFAASLLAAATYIVLRPNAVSDEALATALFALCAPLGVALLAFVPDRGFSFVRAATHSAIGFLPLVVMAFLTAGREHAAEFLTANRIDPIYTDWSGLPQPALFMLLLAEIAVAVRFVMRPRAVDAALFWALPILAASTAAAADSTARGIWINAAAIVLIIAVIETAHAMAFYDELTGLPSRRALNQALSSLRSPYAVAIVDIDHFKSFNDEHGHDVGDQVLRMVAARLCEVGGGGTAYRSGGEEFTLVFPGVNESDALDHVEALRSDVANSRFALRNLPRPPQKRGQISRGGSKENGTLLQVTISVGVAADAGAGEAPETLLRAADAAMYRAKAAGRNRVMA
jgi:diguanylate cyclase (GGDEF)-like protein